MRERENIDAGETGHPDLEGSMRDVLGVLWNAEAILAEARRYTETADHFDFEKLRRPLLVLAGNLKQLQDQLLLLNACVEKNVFGQEK